MARKYSKSALFLVRLQGGFALVAFNHKLGANCLLPAEYVFRTKHRLLELHQFPTIWIHGFDKSNRWGRLELRFSSGLKRLALPSHVAFQQHYITD